MVLYKCCIIIYYYSILTLDEVLDHYPAWDDGTGYPLMKSDFGGYPANLYPDVASGCHYVPSFVEVVPCSTNLWEVGFGLWFRPRR